MGELFERDGHCEHCGCPIYTDPMMGTHCACPPWEPKPAAPADGHAWTFDPHHQAHRCTQCGIVSYDATPAGPCTCAPSTWLPPGADDAPPRPVISNDRCSCGSRLYLGASRCYLCSVPPVDLEPKRTHGTYEVVDGGPGEVIDGARILCREHAPKVDDVTLEGTMTERITFLGGCA